ncbi:hypothetical protein [Niastella sp. OAS944]|uniref:hypothetical protein n=1 Tax=Niastella sp. OAS944 TaxID=2664089 RepID=UPI003486C27D
MNVRRHKLTHNAHRATLNTREHIQQNLLVRELQLKNTTTDGAVTIDKLANDILVSNIMADGTVTTDKLANDILNTMRAGNKALNANASAGEDEQAEVPLYTTAKNNRQLYARFIQQSMLQRQHTSNYKRTGWLQYKVD